MLPSSSRVKLNRVALKDVVGLKLVPRRRRPPKSPHDVSADPKNQEETSVSEQLKAHKHPSSSSQPAGSPPRSQNGSHPPGTRREEEPEEKRKGGTHGPTTGGKYQQGTANTKGRRRVDSVRKVSGLAPRVRRCLCADSDSREVQDRVKPRGKVSKRKRKGRTTAKSLREGGRVKAKVAGCASNTGPVRKETPRRLSNIDRNTHQTSSGLADSEMLMRRAAGVSRCDLCGECKYISLQRKALGKQGPKSAGLGPEPPSPGLKIKEENAVTQTPQKTVIWKNQYPQVTLCDIANKCDACDHGCGYVLPDALKTKVVHCFRKDIRAPFRFWPTCFGRNKPSSEKTALVNGIEHCQSVQLEKSIWDRDAEEDLGTGSDPVDAESRRDKRIKLGESAGCISAFDSAPKDNCTTSRGQRGDPTKTDGAQISSDLFCHINDEEKDEPESFTCQRVRAYFRKVNFSCARAYMAWPFLKNCGASSASTESSVGPVEPSAKGRTDSETVNYNVQGSSSNQVSDILPNVPTDKQEEGREQILAWGDETRHREDMETAPLFIQTEESESRLHLYSASFSTPAQSGRECSTDAVSSSSLLFNGTEIASSVSTSSPSALGLSDWNTATSLSPMSSPFTQGSLSSLSATPSFLPPSLLLSKRLKGVEITAVENTLVAFEETQPTSCSPPVPQYNSDSFQWCESFSTIPQVEHTSPEELVAWRSPPKLELYCNTSPFKGNSSVGCSKQSSLLRSVSQEHCVDLDLDEFMLPPVLSPVSSPQQQMCRRTSSDEENEEEEMNKDPSCFPQISNCSNEKSEDCLGCHIEELDGILSRVTTPGSTPREPRFSPSSDKDVDHSNVGESQEETDSEDDVEQGSGSHEQVSLHRNIKASLNSGVLTEPCSSPSSDEEDGAALSDEGESCSDREEGSGLSKIEGRERDKSEAAGDSQPGILDEFAAYEQDILLVDVIQDDPELFDSLPEQSLLTMGPATVTKAPKSKPTAVANMPRVDVASRVLGQRLTQVTVDVPLNSPAIKEESNSRPWRPQCSTTPIRMQNNTCPATSDKQTKQVAQFDVNNNHVNGGPERNQPIKTVSSPHYIHPLMSIGPGLWIKNSANVTDFRRQKSNSYCRLYFSESLSCGFKMCRFQHLPVEGDEKFCVETVTRFTKNPMCLQKAGAVFTGYYQNNPPGVYFSMPMLFSLLWALLRAGMVSDVFSVLGVSLAHNIVPSHEFLLALFNYVREKGLMGFVPELIQLTFKMANAGLELSLDCLDCVRNAPVFQHMVHSNSPSLSGNHKLSIGAPFPEYLNLAHSIVEMELCMKQEDWKRMGEVFRSICLSSQHPNQVERISGRVAITLLSESKDKLSLPFTAFAETVCQNEGEDSIVRSFVGRIGVSLMLRYHKTHQWAKGRRVVETLCSSKVNYSTLKGLFGNEDGMSRCCLVTVAAELLLLSGSVEGALNTLRENKWFLSSCLWPCEPADLESRTRVLMRLAEKTSHRDTLEVLCNLPGVKEPSDLIDISRYSPLFNSHLRVCVDRQILPVASDTVDFMLAKNLAVDHTVLQVLLHKLGKQNLWLRAREVFRHSLSVGCYPGVSAPPGFMVLIVPCRLGEVELALSFEMFITVNASVIHHLPETTSSSLSITLTRTQSCESEYLSAGSRLLSAACIPQPKLTVHYTAVNAAQEQVFTLDVSSARRWLRHNHLWAHEMWPH